MTPLSLFQIGLKESLFYKDSIIKIITSQIVTNSINLFPTEDRQILRTDKLKVDFKFNSYSCYLEIKNDSKELEIQFDSKIIQNQILENIKKLSPSYAHDVDYLIELFKILVLKIDGMTEEKQDQLAKYFVQNINQKETK